MQFKKLPPLNLLVCEPCQVGNATGFKKCKQCRKMTMGISNRGFWFYWGYPLTRYNLALQTGRRILNRIRLVTAFVLWLNAWIWVGFLMYKQGVANIFRDPIHWQNFFISLDGQTKLLFWLGAVALLYFWYRIIKRKELAGTMEPFKYNYKNKDKNETDNLNIQFWPEAVKLPGRKKQNIAKVFTEEALSALAKAYKLADKNKSKTVGSEHLFYSLLSFNRIANIFIRLGIPATSLQKDLEPLFQIDQKQAAYKGVAPTVSTDLYQIIFQAYEEAYSAH